MTADLLERDPYLATLDEMVARAAQGHGQIAVISGEAGIGKTALVERFVERQAGAVRVLWGACEALFTARPLGPLYDIARQAPDPLRQLLARETNRAALFAAVLDELARGPLPTVLVIEDVHWADEATLDLIKFLGRRVSRTSGCLILTFRDDELGGDHPLRLVLGDLPARELTRIALPALSEAAVRALAAPARRSPAQVYALTGVNPFFVTALLAPGAGDAPASVADAVLGRKARLAPEAQRLLELVAVAPSRIEWRVIASISPEHAAALDACLSAGMLALADGMLGYRHELARQAVEAALPPPRRQALHAGILRALLASEGVDVSLARLVHHASFAEDAAQVLRFAPEAARQAAARGALREAVALYQVALKYAAHLQPQPHAELLEALANALYVHGRFPDALAPTNEALAIWRALDQPESVGRTLALLSRLDRYVVPAAADAHARAAVALLETLPPGQELARAYANLAGLRMVVSDRAQVLLWGRRAIELAERLHDPATECAALNSIGCATWCAGDESGRLMLERSLRLAQELDADSDVLRAFSNLAENAAKHRDFELASRYVDEGLRYSTDRDLDEMIGCLRDTRARVRFDRGEWSAAEEEATALIGTSWRSGPDRTFDLVIIGQLRARRGDPGVAAVLDQARDMAHATREMQFITPVAAARAEWRWLRGDLEGCRAEARVGYELALAVDEPWHWGEAALWLWRGGGLDEAPPRTPAPFALEIAGDWRAAAQAWEALGCPYERALALLAGDEAAQRTALAILEGLGAAPAADIVRRRLLAAGARGLPRGPRPATQANPHGLTPRQLEILLLLAEGLHNAEIADRLSTTPKTVEHHVSAVLAKLGVRSRAEAVRMAFHLGVAARAAEAPVASNVGAS
ncbi:MAG TPA: AAA family ATPase [Ktedonobacterales bacterium]|nr:AAA family ATPase [Ktedonobacterales bacterium]